MGLSYEDLQLMQQAAGVAAQIGQGFQQKKAALATQSKSTFKKAYKHIDLIFKVLADPNGPKSSKISGYNSLDKLGKTVGLPFKFGQIDDLMTDSGKFFQKVEKMWQNQTYTREQRVKEMNSLAVEAAGLDLGKEFDEMKARKDAEQYGEGQIYQITDPKDPTKTISARGGRGTEMIPMTLGDNPVSQLNIPAADLKRKTYETEKRVGPGGLEEQKLGIQQQGVDIQRERSAISAAKFATSFASEMSADKGFVQGLMELIGRSKNKEKDIQNYISEGVTRFAKSYGKGTEAKTQPANNSGQIKAPFNPDTEFEMEDEEGKIVIFDKKTNQALRYK